MNCLVVRKSISLILYAIMWDYEHERQIKGWNCNFGWIRYDFEVPFVVGVVMGEPTNEWYYYDFLKVYEYTSFLSSLSDNRSHTTTRYV